MTAATMPDGERFAPPARFRMLRSILRNANFDIGLAILIAVALAALAAPLLFPDDPLSMVAQPLLWPGEDGAFPLGTDSLGRDVLAELLHGARVSLAVGFLATALALGIGVTLGAAAGFFGGRTDALLVRFIEIFQTPPSFILLIVIVSVAQPSVGVVTVSIGLVTWPTIARLVRGEARSLRERDYITAARGLGFGPLRIIVREMLPNALPPIIVTTSVMVASAILMEAALSFLGLSDPNLVSWGSMIGAGRDQLRGAWYLTAIPGLAIVVTVLALNLLGDGLNDALNPRRRESRP